MDFSPTPAVNIIALICLTSGPLRQHRDEIAPRAPRAHTSYSPRPVSVQGCAGPGGSVREVFSQVGCRVAFLHGLFSGLVRILSLGDACSLITARCWAARCTYCDVMASRCLGASGGLITFRHILPDVTAPIVVAGAFAVAGTILSEA